jgi:hypothetical protein
MHGIIQNGDLVIVGQGYPDAKPVVYEDVPLFDQTTSYVVQQPPVDAGNHIFMGIEIREMEIDDTVDEFIYDA